MRSLQKNKDHDELKRKSEELFKVSIQMGSYREIAKESDVTCRTVEEHTKVYDEEYAAFEKMRIGEEKDREVLEETLQKLKLRELDFVEEIGALRKKKAMLGAEYNPPIGTINSKLSHLNDYVGKLITDSMIRVLKIVAEIQQAIAQKRAVHEEKCEKLKKLIDDENGKM